MSCCLKKDRKFLCTCVQDMCFDEACSGQTILIWESNGLIKPSGTVIINVEAVCASVDLLINGIIVGNLQAGQSFSVTSDPLEKIEVVCNGTSTNPCKGKVSFAVNYEASQCF